MPVGTAAVATPLKAVAGLHPGRRTSAAAALAIIMAPTTAAAVTSVVMVLMRHLDRHYTGRHRRRCYSNGSGPLAKRDNHPSLLQHCGARIHAAASTRRPWLSHP